MTTPSEALDLAGTLSRDLSHIDGVRAVVLGGSQARGTVTPQSDVDIGIYYRGELDTDSINRLVKNLCPGATATPIGGWGPWINGGAWLNVDGQAVDFIYRDLDKVEATIQDCLEGRVTRHLQPGHPHGFFNYIYAGELFFAKTLHDPSGEIQAIKQALDPYSPKLKQAIFDNSLWPAAFALEVATKATARRDSTYVAGCLFECAGDLVQVLHALNEQYFLNEKGSVNAVEAFARKPENFSARVREAMGSVGEDPEVLKGNIADFCKLCDETLQLIGDQG